VRFFRRRPKAEDSGAAIEVAVDGPDETAPEPEPELTEEEEQRTDEALQRTRRSWFGQIAGLFDRGGSIDESLWEELEELLIGADAGVATTQRILDDVRERVQRDRIKDAEGVRLALKETLVDILLVPRARGRLWTENGATAEPPHPAVILVLGVNGSGKTTTIAKMANAYKQDGATVVIAAGDTFRAAAIEQLRKWGQRIGADVIANKQGADPGAVVFDALAAAESRSADAVIIDTAGRLHTKFNLMEELAKIRRIIQRKEPSAPHETLLVLDATTGQNALIQAQEFTKAVDVTAICLTKLDGSSKGGIVFAVADQLDIPVRFVGTGEAAEDFAPFSAEAFVEALFR
jgi:fused signal recognition particle receptor